MEEYSNNNDCFEECRMLTQPPETSARLRKIACRTSGSNRR